MTEQQVDHEAWLREAVNAYQKPLLIYVRGLMGDAARAQEVVQDAFCRLCEQPREAVDGHLAPWLYTVCRHRALDVLRKEKRMSTMTDNQVTGDVAALVNHRLPPAGDDPAAHAARRESVSRVMAIVEALPDQQRELVRLRFQGGLSYKQMSEVTGHSVSNVGFLLHQAIRTIREKMA